MYPSRLSHPRVLVLTLVPIGKGILGGYVCVCVRPLTSRRGSLRPHCCMVLCCIPLRKRRGLSYIECLRPLKRFWYRGDTHISEISTLLVFPGEEALDSYPRGEEISSH